MTLDRDTERLLDTWFAEGPTLAADRVMDDVAARVSRTSQRPGWRLRPWRFPTMSTQIRALSLVGAAFAALLVGGLIIAGGGTSTRTTTPTASAPATPPTSPITFVTGGPIAAGTYMTLFDAGRLTFTVPAGWSSPGAGPTDMDLHLDGGPKDDIVKVFTDMRRSAKDASCTETPELSVQPTVAALLADLAADPKLRATMGETIGIDGAEGSAIDVALAPGMTKTCPFSNGQPSVPLIVDSVAGTGPFWGVGPNERVRLVALQAPRGHNVVVAIDSSTGASFDTLVAAAMPIIRSFVFEPDATDAPVVTPVPSATPPACEDQLAGCAGALDAGAHRSSAFQPSLTYTTPAGWANVVDTPTIFKLDPDSTADPSLILWSNVAIPTGCDAVVKPGTGRKVTDFVNYLTSHPGIDVLSSKPITVAHFSAREMDLAVKPSWTQTCPGIPGFTVQFILDTDPQAGAPIYGLTSNGHMRIVLLEVHGRTVIIQAYGPTSEPGFADAMAKVQPLLDSFEFTLGG